MSGVNETELLSNHRGSQSLRGTGPLPLPVNFLGVFLSGSVTVLNGPQLTASSSLVSPAHCSEGLDLRLSHFNTSIA